MRLDTLLKDRIRYGSLTVARPDGSLGHYGRGEPEARWELYDESALKRIVADPDFMLGQTYMEGAWGTPDLLALFDVLLHNFPRSEPRGWRRLWWHLLKPVQQWNRRATSRRNVARHYDLDEALFRRFLDDDLQYSCAYWPDDELSLEQAQLAKKEHIRRKLQLRPGDRVLDIGCGWGGLAIHLAEVAGVHVTGITLSAEQYRVATQRVRERGLGERVEIRMADYRESSDVYDRIVSVGMFEHVGSRYYDVYFQAVRDRLRRDGVALIHTIGRLTPPGLTNPWIQRYIFPGGYIPALSEVMAAVERQSLVTADVEVLRLHYAKTLAQWRARFQVARADVAAEKGERFCRMWEFYLAASEAGFRWNDLVVFQLQLTRDQQAVPLTRDYLHTTSTRLAGRPREVVGQSG